MSALPAGVGRRPRAEELALAGVPGVDGDVGSARWWESVAAVGTPVWCPDGLVVGAGGQRSGVPTVVFLHRDGSDRGAYLDLVGLTDRSDLAAGIMRRLPGTDVRIAAFGVEPGFVASYGMVPFVGELRSPADRDTPEARRWWLGVLAGSGPDPLARVRRQVLRQGVMRSVVEVAGSDRSAAPDRSAAVLTGATGHDKGTVEAIVWDRPDGVAQPAWVYRPGTDVRSDVASDVASVDSALEVGLLVLFDGRPWAESVPVAPVLDTLHASGRIPPTAAVLLDAMGPDRREADLARTPGYLDLLADDLLPRVVRPVLAAHGLVLSDDPRRTVVAGQSYGGLAAFRAVARRPERFGASVSQSGSLWWPDADEPGERAAVRWLRSAPPRSARTVLQVGAYEGPITAANDAVARVIRERGEHLVHTVVPGGHDWAWWSNRLGAGLVAALGR
jgi:enterochelin esterase family protein